MSRILFEVLFVSILGFSLFVSYDTEAKSKVKLSKKYVPQGNPGGANFYEDEDFAESYRVYEKRRELLMKKKLQVRADANTNKENLAKKLKEKKDALLNSKSSNIEACIVEDGEDAMVNQHGINIARLKGAVFMDQTRHESERLEGKKQKRKEATTTREKKISPIDVIVKDASPKKTCSCDSVADLNSVAQCGLSGFLDSFGSVADTAK